MQEWPNGWMIEWGNGRMIECETACVLWRKSARCTGTFRPRISRIARRAVGRVWGSTTVDKLSERAVMPDERNRLRGKTINRHLPSLAARSENAPYHRRDIHPTLRPPRHLREGNVSRGERRVCRGPSHPFESASAYFFMRATHYPTPAILRNRRQQATYLKKKLRCCLIDIGAPPYQRQNTHPHPSSTFRQMYRDSRPFHSSYANPHLQAKDICHLEQDVNRHISISRLKIRKRMDRNPA